MYSMKIGLPEGQPNKKSGNNKHRFTKQINNKSNKSEKVYQKNITWRDNPDTISAKIGGQIIHISKKNFNIQLKNGFVINCKDLEDAKCKAILLFNT